MYAGAFAMSPDRTGSGLVDNLADLRKNVNNMHTKCIAVHVSYTDCVTTEIRKRSYKFTATSAGPGEIRKK